jgi:hypothetical protein
LLIPAEVEVRLPVVDMPIVAPLLTVTLPETSRAALIVSVSPVSVKEPAVAEALIEGWFKVLGMTTSSARPGAVVEGTPPTLQFAGVNQSVGDSVEAPVQVNVANTPAY